MIPKQSSPKKGPLSAVGYVRMSTDRQQDSPDRQRQLIAERARRDGYLIVAWYVDEAQTGTESKKRLDFQRLISDARLGKFQAVIYSEQSRFSREDAFDVFAHWKVFRDARVMLVSCQKGAIDFDSLGGLITAIIDAHGARAESINLATRVASGKRTAALKGRWQGGAILGYDREVLDEQGRVVKRYVASEPCRKAKSWLTKLAISSDKKSVAAVRTAYDLAMKGTPMSTIARTLNGLGYRSLNGKLFTGSAIFRIVTNPTYVGDLHMGVRLKKTQHKFATILDSGDPIIVREAHPALIERQQFDAVQALLTPGTKRPRSTQPGTYLLTGLLHCATSGARLQGLRGRRSSDGRSYAPNQSYYARHDRDRARTYSAEIIERGVVNKIISHVLTTPNLPTIGSALERLTQKCDTEEARLTSELEEIKRKIAKGTENMALCDPENIPAFNRLLSDWRSRQTEVIDTLKRLQAKEPPQAVVTISKLSKLLPALHNADRHILASAIRATVKKITLRTSITRYGGAGSHYFRQWSGVVEFRDELCLSPAVLTDDDIPNPLRWRSLIPMAAKRGGAIESLRLVEEAFGVSKKEASLRLAAAVAAGKFERQEKGGWKLTSTGDERQGQRALEFYAARKKRRR